MLYRKLRNWTWDTKQSQLALWTIYSILINNRYNEGPFSQYNALAINYIASKSSEHNDQRNPLIAYYRKVAKTLPGKNN